MVEIRVEVVGPADAQGDLSGRALTQRFADRVGDLGDAISTIAGDLQQRITAQMRRPAQDWSLEEVHLKFSIDIEAEAGVLISRAKTAAGFEVTLTFDRKSAIE